MLGQVGTRSLQLVGFALRVGLPTAGSFVEQMLCGFLIMAHVFQESFHLVRLWVRGHHLTILHRLYDAPLD